MSLSDVNLAVMLLYGPVGCACAWVILRTDSKVMTLTRDMIGEIRTLSHRINGLMRAHLISTLVQPNLEPKLRAFGETILAQEEKADAKSGAGK